MSNIPATAQTRTVWFKIPIFVGNLIQFAGLGLGWSLFWMAGNAASASMALMEMLLGWTFLYLSCHAIAHWLVGRLGGIRFRHYTLGGTNKSYPEPLQFIFSHMPFFGVRTEKDSLYRASKISQALMWSAGVISSVVLPPLALLWALKRDLPYSRSIFVFAILWSLATFAANFRQGGDFSKVKSVYRT